jgi:hypothetical protein
MTHSNDPRIVTFDGDDGWHHPGDAAYPWPRFVCQKGLGAAGATDRRLVCSSVTQVQIMKQWVAATMALGLAASACQSGLSSTVAAPPSQARLEYVNEFKKIDAAGKGHITLEEATAYYGARFAELDKNHDGFLDAEELEPLIPIMNARSGKELLFKLDRNSDNRLSKAEFLVIANWLFQLARSQNELTLADVEKNMPASVPASTKENTNDAKGNPAGKGR